MATTTERILQSTGLAANIGLIEPREFGLTTDTERPVMGTQTGGSKYVPTEELIQVVTAAPAAIPIMRRSMTTITCDTNTVGGNISIDIRAGAQVTGYMVKVITIGTMLRSTSVLYASGLTEVVLGGNSATFIWTGVAWTIASPGGLYLMRDMGLLATGSNLNDFRTAMQKWRTASIFTYTNLPTGFSGEGALIVYSSRQDPNFGVVQEYTDRTGKKASRTYINSIWESWVVHPSARLTTGSLDDEILPGFTRFGTGSGLPLGSSGNCITARRAGSDSILQVASGFQSTEPLYWRNGNPTSIGGSGAWNTWRRLWDSNDTGGVTPAARKSIRGFGDGASVIGSTTKAIYASGTSIVAPTWGGQIYWETDGNFTIGGQASGIVASGATIGTLTGTGNTGVYFERIS